MITVTSKVPVGLYGPPLHLLQPVAAQKQPFTGILRFYLRRLPWNELIKVLIDRCGLAKAPVSTVWWSVTIHIMLIVDVSGEPYFALWQEHRNTQRVYWCVSKAFINETSTSVKPLETLLVCFTPPKVQATDLEIGEELAVVVVSTT